ncbi:ABC transporter ATP-binding protein [Plasticicumulans acidivorans]|uniref:Putative ABC transport system ATP-binding protein n=1 Tax=Plasticicumulans acidivorans TaxID=886464 RepID=A0A317MUH9_9GAMM|nr:ATP-binding cassette domain-containing protein [Plasticicumulans acidivorans]PWV61027.1 putative ABC transport system ATP-binding protein [Plasticicumulans acidivorans]
MLELSLSALQVRFPGLAAPALAIERLHIAAGSRVAITGASGSGKSTLVNQLIGLERPRGARIDWSGTDLATLGEGARDRWRGRHVGLVMQDFHLFPGLSALDNVLLPAQLARVADGLCRERAAALLAQVGIRRSRQPAETLSRGEMQRVAVARALLRQPGLLVADEPTASLDADSGAAVADLLLDLASEAGSTLLVVSHDPRLCGRLQRRIELAGGRIVADSAGGTPA